MTAAANATSTGEPFVGYVPPGTPAIPARDPLAIYALPHRYLGTGTWDRGPASKAESNPEDLLRVDGIPFLKAAFPMPAAEGASVDLLVGGVDASELYLLGCGNTDDGRQAWGGGDTFRNVFLNDIAGEIRICYESGKSDSIPLVFGYTVWWRGLHTGLTAPFMTDQLAYNLLDRALCVGNGIEGWEFPYYLKIALSGEPVKSITFQDNASKIGHVVFEAVTFGGVRNADDLSSSTFESLPGGFPGINRTRWQEAHTIDSSNPYPTERQNAVRAVMDLLYTNENDVCDEILASAPPTITAKSFPGPKVSFNGPPIATLLTRVFYQNAFDMQSRVDDYGVVHESFIGAPNYHGFGNWAPALNAFRDWSAGRGRTLTNLSEMGFFDKAESVVDNMDDWLMYFPRSYPDLQLGGKPVPGHAPFLYNRPHFWFDNMRQVAHAVHNT